MCYRIVIRMYPEHSSVLDVVDEAPHTDHDSLNGACHFPQPPNSPFSSRKEIYDSNEVCTDHVMLFGFYMAVFLCWGCVGCLTNASPITKAAIVTQAAI